MWVVLWGFIYMHTPHRVGRASEQFSFVNGSPYATLLRQPMLRVIKLRGARLSLSVAGR